MLGRAPRDATIERAAQARGCNVGEPARPPSGVRLFGTDLALLHPPSVYDFRTTRAEYGPISDVIFSSPAFDMYPVGLTSIASHLEDRGHNVRIVNVAQRMVADPAYDAEAAIAALDPAMFGIDLHWLPHAHGALELARLAKRHHPATPVVMGGLSASYFHEELIRSPHVDFVMRGDTTEEPVAQLLRVVQLGGDPAAVPNLTWKRADGVPVVNPLSWVPPSMAGRTVPDVLYVVRSVFKYGSLADVVPFNGWMRYPITGLLTSRGCAMPCAVCGGASAAYQAICGRARPAFRSPESLVRDVRRLGRFSRGPIFLIHDLRQGGGEHERRVVELLARARPRNEIVLELFAPVADDFLRRVGAALPRWSLQITLESHVERIRGMNQRFACSDEAIVHTIGEALASGVRRVDVFFMIGLPGQSYDDAVGCVDFCRSLLERFGGDQRLAFFAAPLAPFLDPGSAAFERPDAYGYRVRFRTLEEHRRALTAPSWKDMLNYETRWMSRDAIVAATYEALRRLATLKHAWGFTGAEAHAASMATIAASEAAVDAIGRAERLAPGPARDAALADVHERAAGAARAARFQKDHLVWPLPGRRFAPLWSLAWIFVASVARTIALTLFRRLPLWLAAPRPSPRARTAGPARAAAAPEPALLGSPRRPT